MTTTAGTPGTALRLVQISDTHLSRWDGPLRRNFRAIASFVNTQLRPDLVVHTGDVTMSNPDAEADYVAAKELVGLIEAPMRFVPGNHDVGEPYERTWWTTTEERITRFERFFEGTPWLERLGDIALVGLNSQIYGTGLPSEERQWRWLENVAASLRGRSVLVFQHKSFWTTYRGSDGRLGGTDPAHRYRVLDILSRSRLLAIANGDVHRYRKVRQGEHLELWAPATGFLVHREESLRLPSGLEQLGVVQFDIRGEDFDVTFQTTPGLEEVEVGGFEESRLIRGEIADARKRYEAAAP
jgi:hypothetical protein